ncbi:MAG TPA: hypothetical protein VM889_01970 [Candidatus Thermoplasmatota archaeon]|nr:hypothetical protein [Candidatus Thermoplasmatota archaeon]
MRVLHVNNPANVGWALTRALREEGIVAEVLDLYPSPFGFPSDLDADQRGVGAFLTAPRLARLAGRYDVLHFHDCFPRAFRLGVALASAKPKLVFHHHGSLLRSGAARHADAPGAHLVATPDLLGHLPKARYVPTPHAPPVDPVYPSGRGPILVGHYPSNESTKGTPAIRAAVAPLVEAGLARFDVASGLKHREALARMAACDVVVDQWRPDINAHGVVTLEAMGLGKPVVCSVERAWYPGIPVLAGDLEVALAEAARRPERLPEIGRVSRAYVERVHAPKAVAAQLLAVYEG